MAIRRPPSRTSGLTVRRATQGQATAKHAESNTLTYGAGPGDKTYLLSKQFSTGGELLVGFANSFVWQFAGPDSNVTSSLLNFSLVQPLLRNGGRALILETLTRAERNLLSNLRLPALSPGLLRRHDGR